MKPKKQHTVETLTLPDFDQIWVMASKTRFVRNAAVNSPRWKLLNSLKETGLPAIHYPQLLKARWDNGSECSNRQVEEMSFRRRSPRQMVFTPGSPS